MEFTISIIISASFGAAFGAISGKLLDAFLLSKINDDIEKNKWLRQARLEAFSQLSEELLSLGFKSGHAAHKWRLQGYAAKTILLLDNKDIISKINHFIEDLSNISTDASIDDTDMKTITDKSLVHFAGRSLMVTDLESKALEIVGYLSKELK